MLKMNVTKLNELYEILRLAPFHIIFIHSIGFYICSLQKV
jgi:hypothetical protein